MDTGNKVWMSGIGALLIFSFSLVAYSIFINHKANQEFTDILGQQLKSPISKSVDETEALSLDQQIQEARRQ